VTSEALWHYPDDLCALLQAHGISPRPETHPRLVRDYLSDLYRFEIRRLRDERRAGTVAKTDYIGRVIELRKKYIPLSLTPDEWERAFR
jgi:hypothetical protein